MKKISLFCSVLIIVLLLFCFEFYINFPIFPSALAAVFDSDLIPKQNSIDLGTVTPTVDKRFRDARFSGIVGIKIDSSRDTEVNFSDRIVLGPEDIILAPSEGGQIKFLGPNNNQYTIVDNHNNSFRILGKNGSVGGTTTRLTVFESGNVRIGSSTSGDPGEKLEVEGNIISKGTEWKFHNSNIENDYVDVAYGNGRFVALANNSGGSACVNNNYCVMTSTDGINWTTSTIPSVGNFWSTITYGNGLFVAVASDLIVGTPCNSSGQCVMTSSDGKSWTSRTVQKNNWQSIVYGNGLFVALAASSTLAGSNCGLAGQTNCVMTSPNGINWSLRSVPVAEVWSSVTYGNGLFVAVGSTGINKSMYSTNGITWITRATPGGAFQNNWRSVTYGNGLFVAVASQGISDECYFNGICVMTSKDAGISDSWTLRYSESALWRSVTYGNGLFVAVGDWFLATSPDGINWTKRDPLTFPYLSSIAYGNGIFVSVSSNYPGNRVMTSGKTDYQITPHNNIYQGGMRILGSATGTLSIGTTTFANLFTVASSSNIFTVTMDSKVGIGTASPAATLTIIDRGTSPAIYGGGGLRVLQPKDNQATNLSHSVWNGSTSIGGYSDFGIAGPFTILSGTTTFYTGAGVVSGMYDKYGNWYLDGANTSSSIKLTGTNCSDCPANSVGTSTIYKSNGSIGISANTTNGLLSLGSSTSKGVLIGPPWPPLNLGEDWKMGTTSIMGSNSSWQSIAFGIGSDGVGRFVAIADAGATYRMMMSTSGMIWTDIAVTSPSYFEIHSKKWNSIAYGKIGGTPYFVAVGSDGNSAYSNDGKNWSIGGVMTSQNWKSVAYGNNRFVAIADSGGVSLARSAYSTDGQLWVNSTLYDTNYQNSWTSIAYGDGVFVAVARNGLSGYLAQVSIDGNDWNQMITPLPDRSWRSVTFANGLFVAVAQYIAPADDGHLVMTSNGSAWDDSMATPLGNYYWSSVVAGIDEDYNNLFVAVSKNSGGTPGYQAMTSNNGINWFVQQTPTIGDLWNAVAFANNIYVAVGETGAERSMYAGVVQNAVIKPPTEKLWVLGDLRVGTSTNNGCIYNYNSQPLFGDPIKCPAPSDIRLKKNLVPLARSLDKLIELSPVYYNWRAAEYPELQLSSTKINLGLIAQDVEKVLPELVGKNDKGFKTVNYGVDLLMHEIGALSELKAENDSLEALVEKLERKRGIDNK